jgi:GNAT superfamily N-acetyltransferase
LDRTDVRGLGIGRRLLVALEEVALARGMSTVRLDTHEALTEAIRLYETPGYHQIPAYGENPNAGLWFEKQLKAP